MTSPQTVQSSEGLSAEHFQFLQAKIYEHSGIVIDRSKQYLVEARLTPVVQRRQLGSLNALSNAIRAATDAMLLREVIESMTTHESYFFRDHAQFEVLRTRLIPDLMTRRAQKRRLTFWSAAASSGQEAYTLAMTLREMHLANWKLEILATDLSDRILTRAKEGLYSAHETSRGTFPPQLRKYFEQSGQEYRICDSIRNMVEFKKFDLRTGMSGLSNFDVIFCRNVLIYFDENTRRKILEELSRSLAPDGILFLGSTESTIGLTERFTRKLHEGAIYYEHAR